MEKEREQRDSESFQVLDKIEDSIKGDADLEVAYDDVKRSIRNYHRRLEIQKERARSGERLGAKETTELDDLRKISHDALIDRLNILSRLSAKKGIEPNWRKSWGPIGSQAEREAITAWVEAVMPALDMEKEQSE